MRPRIDASRNRLADGDWVQFQHLGDELWPTTIARATEALLIEHATAHYFEHDRSRAYLFATLPQESRIGLGRALLRNLRLVPPDQWPRLFHAQRGGFPRWVDRIPCLFIVLGAVALFGLALWQVWSFRTWGGLPIHLVPERWIRPRGPLPSWPRLVYNIAVVVPGLLLVWTAVERRAPRLYARLRALPYQRHSGSLMALTFTLVTALIVYAAWLKLLALTPWPLATIGTTLLAACCAPLAVLVTVSYWQGEVFDLDVPSDLLGPDALGHASDGTRTAGFPHAPDGHVAHREPSISPFAVGKSRRASKPSLERRGDGADRPRSRGRQRRREARDRTFIGEFSGEFAYKWAEGLAAEEATRPAAVSFYRGLADGRVPSLVRQLRAERAHEDLQRHLGSYRSWNRRPIGEFRQRAMQALVDLAEAGDPTAMYELGTLAEEGGHDQTAVAWYDYAAGAGDERADRRLAEWAAAESWVLGDRARWAERRGDPDEAAGWYLRAAEAGEVGALLELGWYWGGGGGGGRPAGRRGWQDGGGVRAVPACSRRPGQLGDARARPHGRERRQRPRRYDWYLAAYKAGAPTAMEGIWRLAQTRPPAMAALQSIAETGDAWAMRGLGRLAEEHGDLGRAIAWYYRDAQVTTDPWSLTQLGRLAAWTDKARVALEALAAQGDARAGRLLDELPDDPVEAELADAATRLPGGSPWLVLPPAPQDD